MPLDLNLAEVEIVLAVIAAKTVRGAARAMSLKPSHVSKVVCRVEKELGVQLLMRSSSGVMLTRDGLAFRDAAKDLLKRAEALGALRHGGTETVAVPVITIGAAAFLARSLVAAAIGDLTQEVKGLRFRVLEVPPDGVLAAGMRGAIDAAVHVGSLDWTRLWTSKTVGDLAWGLYGRIGHPIGPRATAVECGRWPFVVPTYWSGSEFAPGNDQCPLSWDARVQGHEASSADAAVAIAAGTDHLIFVPRVVTPGARLAEVKVAEWDEVRRPLVLSVRGDRVKQALLTKLMKAVAARL